MNFQSQNAARSPNSVGVVAYGAVILTCVLIAVADYRLSTWVTRIGSSKWMAEYLLCTLFVLQVFVLALVAGKTLSKAPGRWLFFGWCLVVINLLLFSAMDTPATFLRFSLLSAQVSMLCVWCFLGQTELRWRLSAVVLLVPLLSSWAFGVIENGWPLIVLLQCLVVLAASGWMRWMGYRIRTDAHVPQETVLRFRVCDLMLWTLAIGLAIFLLKPIAWLRILDVSGEEIATGLCIAVAFALTTLLTLHATLGTTSTFRVIVFIFVIPAFIGYLLWSGFDWRASTLGGWGGSGHQQLTSLAIRIDSRWVIWMVLFNSFLACLLFLFRADGQKLTRAI